MTSEPVASGSRFDPPENGNTLPLASQNRYRRPQLAYPVDGRADGTAAQTSARHRRAEQAHAQHLANEDFEFPDLLGAAYEYLIAEFADSAGKWPAWTNPATR